MSFNVALSGLNAAATDLGTISNNIANAGTVGFKASRTEFGDFFRSASYDLSATATGAGVNVQRVSQQFGQGSLTTTSNALDLAISGDGFFTLSDNGSTVYSRAGVFGTDASGYVVNASGQRLQVFPLVDGTDSFNTGALQDLRLSSAANPPSATTRAEVDLNLPATDAQTSDVSFSPLDPTSYNQTTSMTVYDSLGSPHTASLFYSREAADGAWTLHVTVDGTEVGTGTALQFDNAGALVTPADGQLTLPGFTPSGGAAELNLTLDIGTTTQYGDTFSIGSLSQDGYATGQLSGIEVTSEGVVQARYTNGQISPLGQVAMANFANTQGLQQLGDATWGETYASGQALRGTAGSTNFGLVQSGALESSNVDLTEQLVAMMTAQRNYQANSQVISTSDQLMQVIMNLR